MEAPHQTGFREPEKERLPKQKRRDLFNPHHDESGRFAERDGPHALVAKLLAIAESQKTTLRVGRGPYQTRFILPDGTRLDGGQPHDEVTDQIGLDLDAVMAAGIVRSTGQEGGIEIRQPLTEAQAAVIADDWNFHYKSPLHVDMGVERRGKSFGPEVHTTFKIPFTADALRNWTKRPTKE